MAKSSKLMSRLEEFLSRNPRSNPPEEVDYELLLDLFIREVKMSGEATKNWNEDDWIRVARRIGFEEIDISSAIEQVAAWGIDDA